MDIPEKEYVGQTRYLLAANKEQIYCMLYKSRTEGTLYAKRFKLGAYILDKEYNLIPSGCVVQELLIGDGYVLQVDVSSKTRRTRAPIVVRFADLAMRSREAMGFKVTAYPATSIKILERPTDDNTTAPPPDDAPAQGDAPAQPPTPSDAPTQPPTPSDAPTQPPDNAPATPPNTSAPPAPPQKPDKPPKMFQLSFFDDDSFK